jgi:hypothetical protein
VDDRPTDERGWDDGGPGRTVHITVSDVTTGHSGTIVLESKQDGPFVWEIGHTGNYTTPAGQYCIPGSATKPPCAIRSTSRAG